VVISLFSDEFTFVRGRILMALKADPEVAFPGSVVNNQISSVDLKVPGAYALWLYETELRSRSNDASVLVNAVVRPWNVRVRRKHLEDGAITVRLPPMGVFRITVVDERHRPLPRRQLMGYRDETTHVLSTDESGSVLMYGNPMQIELMIEPGTGVIIDHLALG
jgi:hypothetical protein